MTDPLDWEILEDQDPEAGPSDAEVSRPAQPPGRSATPRWWWIGGLIPLVAAAAWALRGLMPDSGETQLRAGVATLAAAEPRAVPIPFAIRVIGQPQVEQLADDGAGRVNATLVFTATDVDHQTLRFQLERADVVTARNGLQPDPRDLGATRLTLAAADGYPHLELELFAEDEAFIREEIAPYLNDVANEACRVWSCPDNAIARFSFTQTEPGPGQEPLEPLAGSWMLAGATETFNVSPARLPAPSVAGRPADAQTLAAYRRRLALRLLPLLARGVSEPRGRPMPTTAQPIAVVALATRTAVLLGLEPQTVAAAQPSIDDAGLINAVDIRREELAARLLPRLNVLLGQPGSQLERDVWSRLGSAPIELNEAVVAAARAMGRPPEAAFAYYFGNDLADAVLGKLRAPGWVARASCLSSIQFYGPDGASAVSWNASMARPVLDFVRLSSDGALQPMLLAGRPLLLQTATGRLSWIPEADDEPTTGVVLAWENARTLLIMDGQSGNRVSEVTVDDSGPNPLKFVELPALPEATSTYRWPGTDYVFALPDTTGPDSRAFRAIEIRAADGTVVSDWGDAAWPTRNDLTGEVAALSRVPGADGNVEYRITIYTGPTDTPGRVIWHSRDIGWTVREPPTFAAIDWSAQARLIVGVLLPSSEPPSYRSIPVIWKVDLNSGLASELPTTGLAPLPLYGTRVSPDGRFLAVISAADNGIGTQTQLVRLADGATMAGFDDVPGYLEWAPTGHAFALFGLSQILVYHGPEEPDPFWTLDDARCSLINWAAESSVAAPVVAPGAAP